MSTKQIVFLQRPCLPQKIKKKESKVSDRDHISQTSLAELHLLSGCVCSMWIDGLL